MIIRKVKVTEYEYQAPINYVAGATEPDIQFQLTDYEIPSGATGRVYVGRSDGTFEYTVATISGNNVTVAPTSSMFSVKGPGAIQVTLYVGNEVVKNFAVPVYVHADLADDSAEAGSDVTGVFRAAEEQALADFQEQAEEIAEEVKESIPADYTELTEEVDELNERFEQVSEVIGSETIEEYDYVPLSFSTPEYTSSSHGITYTQGNNGEIHIYGTNDMPSSRVLFNLRGSNGKYPILLTGNKTYRLIGCPSSAGSYFGIDLRFDTGGAKYIDSGEGVIFTVPETATYYMTFAVSAGATIDVTFTPEVDERIVIGEITVNKYSAKDITARDGLKNIVVENKETITDDLDISDASGNVLVSFSDGHIKTKNFDSSNIDVDSTVDARQIGTNDDLDVSDSDGNVLARFYDGHFQTKRFNSLYAKTIEQSRSFGKKISVLGDSISTFVGFSPNDWNPYYPTYGPDVDSVKKMWYSIVANAISGTVIASASWGASGVCGNSEDSTGNVGSSTARIEALSVNGVEPDIIFVEMGTNDWSSNRTIGNFDANSELPANGNITDFSQAYAKMVSRIMSRYPLATVYCMTISARLTSSDSSFPIKNSNGVTIPAFNDEIRKIARIFGAKIIDISSCGISIYNLDVYAGEKQLHPNAAGQALMAQEIISELLK